MTFPDYCGASGGHGGDGGNAVGEPEWIVNAPFFQGDSRIDAVLGGPGGQHGANGVPLCESQTSLDGTIGQPSADLISTRTHVPSWESVQELEETLGVAGFELRAQGDCQAVPSWREVDGDEDGDIDGDEDGDIDGDEDGDIDGDEDGDIDGDEDGDIDGDEDGDIDGDEDGDIDDNDDDDDDDNDDDDNDDNDDDDDDDDDNDDDDDEEGASSDSDSSCRSVDKGGTFIALLIFFAGMAWYRRWWKMG